MTTASSDVVHPFVLELAVPAATDLALTGGKGSSLARLATAGASPVRRVWSTESPG
ncbi:hypothetical protein AB1046_16615 [Promicromonospora sp. Populi]|uniref:hypothetical protein n=1 Tax=Promicromonospora sp. Populi TaxID=3239420 RepID=UPI0034E231BD